MSADSMEAGQTNSGEQSETPIVPHTEQGKCYNLQDLQILSFNQLIERAQEIGTRVRLGATKNHLIADQVRFHLAGGANVEAEGILEISGNTNVLRWPLFNFKNCPEDALVSHDLVRKYQLASGWKMKVRLRLPQHRERQLMVDTILAIEDTPIEQWQIPTDFDKLTPLFPDRRILLENPEDTSISGRAMDLVSPLGLGQRGLIVAPPRAGKTMLLKDIARAIRRNHPEIQLILLLVDERPEEVTDMRREIDAEIYSSTFDEPTTRHVQVCELVAERAKRLVEHRKDVVILVDSITRVARGYNNSQPGKGRTMSGGVDSKALAKPRKFFGSARNVEEGGSLTILATALVETQSRMDDLIFEEFKGTGNMEVHLDRTIAEQRIFPAIHIVKSGTRREEMLYHPQEYEKIVLLRRQLSDLPAVEAMEVLSKNLRLYKTNAELLLAGLKGF